MESKRDRHKKAEDQKALHNVPPLAMSQPGKQVVSQVRDRASSWDTMNMDNSAQLRDSSVTFLRQSPVRQGTSIKLKPKDDDELRPSASMPCTISL